MNIVSNTQEILIGLIKKAEANTQFSGLKNPAKVFRWKMDIKPWLLNLKSNDYELRLKSIGTYLFDASIEGLKQNILGPNINMEFLVLSAHAWLILASGFVISFPEYIAGRYFGKRDTEADCPDYKHPDTHFKLCLQ